ncbi:MAG: hypothetical protein J5I52_03450 [Saprospiraceae bacterium]|nr:hypothetical protein [Saprospiraceae bacterium]MCZ2338739.1 hypothetical protein [Chitinophagales bacterium]
MRKSRLLLSITLSLIFIVIGLDLIFSRSLQENAANPLMFRIIGIAMVAFFSLMIVSAVKKYSGK